MEESFELFVGLYDEAVKATDKANAVGTLRSILESTSYDLTSDEGKRLKEKAIYAMADIFAEAKDAGAIKQLVSDIGPFFDVIPKARTAKIVRTIMDKVAAVPDSVAIQFEVCTDCVIWCTEQKRTFLRQRLETRLVQLQLKTERFTEALTKIGDLVAEVKKIDDKPLLVEIHLTEAQVHHVLSNLPKAKAALTAARTNANAIYVAPELQADIDMVSGVINAEEKDYKTSYSYFYEAFEAFDSVKGATAKAKDCFKYMLLCKVMSGDPNDVSALVSGKFGIKHAGTGVNALKAISDAYRKRSLKDYSESLVTFKEELNGDAIISRHLKDLGETLLEQNLIRIIEPYSCVEISHVASTINLPIVQVEAKLSQMILDAKFSGILDQGQGHLLVFDDSEADRTYEYSLATVEKMGLVVESLFSRAKLINSV